MVAYNFHRIFAPAVSVGTKRQTVRADRRRHARPGEAVQLYTGMRQRGCRKLVDPDPVCAGFDTIRLIVPDLEQRLLFPVEIEINGIPLTAAEAEAFAIDDGFDAVSTTDDEQRVCGWVCIDHVRTVSPARMMAAFWLDHHGPGPWQGVIVRW